MPDHKASVFNLRFNWKPGAKYMELPDQKIEMGSKAPNFVGSITAGIPGLLGSDVAYIKWNLHVNHHLNMKLAGRLNYMAGVEGFLNAHQTYIPDLIHFQGNQILFATNFLNSFQLASYYQFSNQSDFNAFAHLEYHLNGWITNKIPILRKLNWFLVAGLSGLHISNGTDYAESHIGMENIFKVLRLDYVHGYLQNGSHLSGIKLTVPFTRR